MVRAVANLQVIPGVARLQFLRRQWSDDARLAVEPRRSLELPACGVIDIPAGARLVVMPQLAHTSIVIDWANRNQIYVHMAHAHAELPAIAHLHYTGTGAEDLRSLINSTVLRSLSLPTTNASTHFSLLKHLPNLESLDLKDATDEDFQRAAKLQHLQFFHAVAPNVSDQGLARLLKLPWLMGLDLEIAAVSEIGLGYLAQLQVLQQLEVSGRAVQSPHALKVLESVPALRRLHLDNCMLSNLHVEQLRKLVRLRSLSLRRAVFQQPGLPFLSRMTELDTLDLAFSNQTDDCIETLSRLPHLVSLSVGWSPIAHNGLRHFDKLTGLRHLAVSGPAAGEPERVEPDISFLSNYPDMRELDLGTLRLTDENLSVLKNLPRLRALSVFGAEICGTGFAALSSSPQLEELYAAGTNVVDDSLRHLAGLTALRILYFKSRSLSDAGLHHLHALDQLQSLQLPDCDITDSGLAMIAQHHPMLQTLELDGCRNIGSAGIAYLQGNQQLRELCLSFTEIDDAAVHSLVANQRLEKLKLTMTQVSDACVEDLLRLPNLNWLEITARNVTKVGLQRLAQNQALYVKR